MGSNPTFLAIVAALILGVLVPLWNAALKRLTGPELMTIIGLVYLAVGSSSLLANGQFRVPEPGAVRIGLLTAAIYASSFLVLGRLFGDPHVNLPVATAVSGAYPAVTALIGLLFLGSRFTPLQSVFFMMTVGGVVGLSLTGK